MKIEYIFTKKKDDFCNNKAGFIDYLKSNVRISFGDDFITIDKKKFSYKLSENTVDKSNEIVFHLTIEPYTKKSKEKQIEELESANDVLQRINEKYSMFCICTIWDDVSIYYAEALYAPIEQLENQLRKIIYLFMINNVGSTWIEQNIPDQVRESIDNTKKKCATTYDDNILYYADFIVLGRFFFTKYPLNNDYQKLIGKLKKEENQTKEKLNELIEQFDSKSNWERYFADKINIENLESKWQTLYGYRNNVAHSKCIRKKDYQEALTLIEELKKAFDECLKIVDDVEISVEQSEAVEKVATATIGTTQLLTGLSGFQEDSLIKKYLKNYGLWRDCIGESDSKILSGNLYSALAVGKVIGQDGLLGKYSGASLNSVFKGDDGIYYVKKDLFPNDSQLKVTTESARNIDIKTKEGDKDVT